MAIWLKRGINEDIRKAAEKVVRQTVEDAVEGAELDCRHCGCDGAVAGQDHAARISALGIQRLLTSRPLPSPSLRSMTAKAGGAVLIAAIASETLVAVRAVKPGDERARARRSQNRRPSSTTNAVGIAIDDVSPTECLNYFQNAGYG